MRTTGRDLGGGVLGFAIAVIAFAFGSALGVPPSVRLLVIGAGALLASISAGMRGFGLAALVLGGIVLVSSMTVFGALGASRELQAEPHIPTVDDTTGAKGDGGYILTPDDKQWVETSWRGRTEAEQRGACAAIRNGISQAELQDAYQTLQHIPRLGLAKGIPTEQTEAVAFLRARFAYTETELC